MTKIIGLTGGIGSGKSTIAAYFASKGVPVYIADDQAKKILYASEASAQVKEVFGEIVFTDGQPDRKKLSEVVFNNPEKLKQLNAIIHPKVSRHFEEWVKQHNAAKFVIKEAAILFESGSYKNCDAVILVTAPKEVRIKRVMNRDNVSRENVLARMANQWEDEKKEALSNYIITNESLEIAKEQADNIISAINSEITD
ncbi:dephospho-CoA kinase [Flavobacterium sp.]|uniref:dephospho-CoA kinase n=1 Tax=Flavobacterium sp. TaxID=239 RepID=UPI002602F7E1|nr:dephospho-CoA kinase [Flavobacterium sp.]